MKHTYKIAFVTTMLALAFLALDAGAYEVQLPTIKGTQPYAGPAQFVQYLFIFGLGIGGLLAFAMIVFAGLEWSLAGANPSLQEDARDRIKNAAFGLMLLLGAYVILNTVNPDIVRLNENALEGFTVPPPPPPPAPDGGGGGEFTGGPTPVTPFDPDPYPLAVSPMDPEARQSLLNMVADAKVIGATVKLNSAYRPHAYQQHLQEVFCKYQCAYNGRNAAEVAQQWRWATYCDQYAQFTCQAGGYPVQFAAAMKSILDEWVRHDIVAAPATISTHQTGCAVDMHISGISPAAYGFERTVGSGDPVHYEHVGCPDNNRVYQRRNQ